VANQHVDGFII